ncbi:MAG TPA: undecaprenyl diphosphate synthase family protein, partial [Herpetosiphonaceae bacterium]
RGTDYAAGDELTMRNIAGFASWMYRRGVEALSVYLISKENLRRPPADLDPVIATETWLAAELLPPLLREFDGRAACAGDLGLLPPGFAAALENLCRATAAASGPRLSLLTAYNPQEELARALRLAAARPAGNAPAAPFDLADLWVPEPLDLVIRTSGEQRISNFLPLQCGYAELIFTPKHFNDLGEDDLNGFLDEYRARQRRFGA